MNKKVVKASLILNIIILLMVVFACVIMFTGIKFMHGHEIALEVTKLEMFKFFTVDSNLLMGIAALVFAYYDYLVITNKKKEIPTKVYAFKHVATASVLLTFVVTLFYLAPFSEYEFLAFFRNSNLFFHLIVPIISAFTFILYEKKNQDKEVVMFGLIPMVLYSIFYVIVYFITPESASSIDRDWYRFLSGGLAKGIMSIFTVYIITYLISYALWIFNKKNYKR